jgi:hypothetical protein
LKRSVKTLKICKKPIDNRFFTAHNAITLSREEGIDNAQRREKAGSQSCSQGRSESRAAETRHQSQVTDYELSKEAVTRLLFCVN